MALEPVMPVLDSEEDAELAEFRRRFWWTLPLTLVVLGLAMFGDWFVSFPMPIRSGLELALATPVIVWGGWPFFVRGVQSILHRHPNMWTLIGLGVAVAYGYVADRATGGPGTALACSHAAHGGRGVGLVRPGRNRGGCGDFRSVGPVWPRAPVDLCAAQCAGGADHRLPLRAGPGYAYVNHGGDRSRRELGHPVS